MGTCLFAKPLHSNGSRVFLYLAVVALQRVDILQYIVELLPPDLNFDSIEIPTQSFKDLLPNTMPHITGLVKYLGVILVTRLTWREHVK
jgi:hypothetical protein